MFQLVSGSPFSVSDATNLRQVLVCGCANEEEGVGVDGSKEIKGSKKKGTMWNIVEV